MGLAGGQRNLTWIEKGFWAGGVVLWRPTSVACGELAIRRASVSAPGLGPEWIALVTDTPIVAGARECQR